MNPFPKFVNWLMIASGVITSLLALQDVLPPKIAVVVVLAAKLVSSLSHSLTGSGGMGGISHTEKGLTKNLTTS